MKKIDMRILVLAILAVVPLLPYLYIFHEGFSHKSDDWGNFGSFMGGAVAPFLSVLSIVLVLRTIELTQKNHAEQLSQVTKEHNYNKFNDLCGFLERSISKSWLVNNDQRKQDVIQRLTRRILGDIIYQSNENATPEEQRQYAEENAERILPFISDDIREIIVCLDYFCGFILDDKNQDIEFMKNIAEIRLDNHVRFIISLYIYLNNKKLNLLLIQKWKNFRPSIEELV
ncbi:TPA: hypothetical protein ACTADG_002587 [Salmonella enterica subsp. enterica serovar Havana]|uniref:DUF4760 domain-containing protein n=2 Tax=Salmonella enterica I TaxID=59201 RepID=A0A3T9Z4C4_SALET|nr:hypothetical protein [Salmonella enterica]EAA8613589.1 hypothetical protein [Salmonella enterica subsp. enterica]EED9371503.1 hypothetical protein [Salmonella enterica subsp. enterica serovar Agbeni]QUY75736.1 hypothetical protein JYN15_19485 [Salmonella enterica subsp. enterica serovar Havana str. CFSAN001082]EAA2678285.1 hypothetical protein [Salmonella enterica subsp. enterica serovar Havana]EAA3820113.1 hypothetical protein [Salmonella enterica subsp. enterica serovar Havana]